MSFLGYTTITTCALTILVFGHDSQERLRITLSYRIVSALIFMVLWLCLIIRGTNAKSMFSKQNKTLIVAFLVTDVIVTTILVMKASCFEFS